MSNSNNWWLPKQARVFRKKINTHGKTRFPNFETWCRFKMNKRIKYEFDSVTKIGTLKNLNL